MRKVIVALNQFLSISDIKKILKNILIFVCGIAFISCGKSNKGNLGSTEDVNLLSEFNFPIELPKEKQDDYWYMKRAGFFKFRGKYFFEYDERRNTEEIEKFLDSASYVLAKKQFEPDKIFHNGDNNITYVRESSSTLPTCALNNGKLACFLSVVDFNYVVKIAKEFKLPGLKDSENNNITAFDYIYSKIPQETEDSPKQSFKTCIIKSNELKCFGLDRELPAKLKKVKFRSVKIVISDYAQLSPISRYRFALNSTDKISICAISLDHKLYCWSEKNGDIFIPDFQQPIDKSRNAYKTTLGLSPSNNKTAATIRFIDYGSEINKTNVYSNSPENIWLRLQKFDIDSNIRVPTFKWEYLKFNKVCVENVFKEIQRPDGLKTKSEIRCFFPKSIHSKKDIVEFSLKKSYLNYNSNYYDDDANKLETKQKAYVELGYENLKTLSGMHYWDYCSSANKSSKEFSCFQGSRKQHDKNTDGDSFILMFNGPVYKISFNEKMKIIYDDQPNWSYCIYNSNTPTLENNGFVAKPLKSSLLINSKSSHEYTDSIREDLYSFECKGDDLIPSSGSSDRFNRRLTNLINADKLLVQPFYAPTKFSLKSDAAFDALLFDRHIKERKQSPVYYFLKDGNGKISLGIQVPNKTSFYFFDEDKQIIYLIKSVNFEWTSGTIIRPGSYCSTYVSYRDDNFIACAPKTIKASFEISRASLAELVEAKNESVFQVIYKSNNFIRSVKMSDSKDELELMEYELHHWKDGYLSPKEVKVEIN